VIETHASYVAVLEYCAGGSLQRLLQKGGACDRPHALGLGEDRSRAIAHQICAALGHMHDLGIAHRDVKPENVLFVRPDLAQVKLCDFGFAVACGGRRLKTVCGTPQYMAPEIEATGTRAPYHGWAADMWSYGAMVYELLEGKPAFRGSSTQQLAMRVVRASHEAFTAATPQPARALIKRLLVVDPEKRLAASDCLANASWFAPRRSARAMPAAEPPLLRPTGSPERAVYDDDEADLS